MAFTVAHMAAALPFYRSQRWLNFEALLIGTMLPDLPYFLNSSVKVADQSHQWIGVLSYCLPYGLLVFALWYWLLKPAAIALIQPWGNVRSVASSISAQQHSAQHPFGLWFAAWFKFYLVFWLKVILALLLGSVTHLLWDGTTHPDGFIALQIPWLQHSFDFFYLGDMSVARLLQYVSSLAGLLLLFSFVHSHLFTPHYKSLADKEKILIAKRSRLKKWHSRLIISLLCASGLFWGLLSGFKSHKLLLNDTYLFLAKILVGGLQGAVGLFIVYALFYQIIIRTQRGYILSNKNRNGQSAQSD